MSSGGAGAADARRASELNQNLFRQYAQIGAPALGGALNYTRGALAQGGLPGYVEQAYRGARVGAMEENVQNLAQLRSRAAGAGDASQIGGQYLQGMGRAVGSAGDALTREQAAIGSSRALAGVEQRNKLLGLLSGGAATATNLSAGFGALGNQAISLNRQPDQTFGLITGGLSAATGLYGALNQNNTGILGFNPNAPGTYDRYLDAYHGGSGTQGVIYGTGGR